MPVYNGEKFISQAIDSLRKQTYANWKLLISDNASEDGTAEIYKKYCRIDNRITYYQHQKNISGQANFKFLIDKADSKYFMWAAHDDIWHPDFISSCIKMLEKDKNAGMAFSNIVNIDSFERVIRIYPSFKKFAEENNFKRVFNYVKDPEIMGKANIIYGVYRLSACKKIWNIYPLNEKWGSDMVFVLAALSRYGLCIDNRVLFQKRIVRDCNQQKFISEIKVTNSYKHILPINKAIKYIKENLRAVRGSGYFFLVLIIMLGQLSQIFLNSFFSKLKKLLNYFRKFIYFDLIK